uniref:Uncharacterized protein n=1 Tax=Aegilops tauschii subsp. strangulata TaxID=200361 RepID=A0A453GUH2_AEGTS
AAAQSRRRKRNQQIRTLDTGRPRWPAARRRGHPAWRRAGVLLPFLDPLIYALRLAAAPARKRRRLPPFLGAPAATETLSTSRFVLLPLPVRLKFETCCGGFMNY